jgi:malonyl CoA-acyl carrier protein transacylase
MREQAGVDAFLEVGPGSVLSGLDRRIVPGTLCAPLGDPDQLRKLLAGAAAVETAAAGAAGEA